MSAEKRLHRRKLVNARVSLEHSLLGKLETYTHDISNGGTYVLVQDVPDVPIGSVLQMCMLDSGQPDIIFEMELVRIDKLGLGLKFLGYTQQGQKYTMTDLQQVWKNQSKKA